MFKRAQFNGILPKFNYLTARYTYNSHLEVLKSDLDLRFITQDGQVGFFDCKSFDDDHFSFSMIDEDQLKTSALYNAWNVSSGFIVVFRPINQVVFFSGRKISEKGPNSSFYSTDGLLLGRIESFDLRLLFE